MTERDMARLELIVEAALKRNDYDKENAMRLSEDLEWANIIEAENIPRDLVTMNSKVCVRDVGSGKEMTFTLVYPEAADLFKGKISVLAPVGSAVLGYRRGDIVEWKVPSGKRRLKIEKVFRQSEMGESQKESRNRISHAYPRNNRPAYRNRKENSSEGGEHEGRRHPACDKNLFYTRKAFF